MKESFTILRPDIRFDPVNIQFDVENHRYLICLLSSMRSKQSRSSGSRVLMQFASYRFQTGWYLAPINIEIILNPDRTLL